MRLAFGWLSERDLDKIRDMVLRKTLLLIGAGVAVGILGALLGTRLLAAQLWGHISDPVTLGAVVALILGVGLAAGYIPARRATRVEPMVALRYE